MNDFDGIRESHGPRVWSIVSRILKHHDDALDCFQEVFTEAIVRSRRAAVNDWGALLCWLATRRAIDALRRRKRTMTSGNVEALCDSSRTAEQHVSFEELVERVRSELGHLPPRQAEAFWLVCVENRTYEEVAQQMGLQRNAVGVLVHRARQHMRDKLNSYNSARPSRN